MAENKAEFTADLLLWRHADAEDGMPDSGRALTKKGLRQAKQVAQWLKPRCTRSLASCTRRGGKIGRAHV